MIEDMKVDLINELKMNIKKREGPVFKLSNFQIIKSQ